MPDEPEDPSFTVAVTLRDLAREIPELSVPTAHLDTRVRGVRHDSREVLPGDLFVARRGANEDGARHVSDAIRRGAAAVLCDRDLALPVPCVIAPDVPRALAIAASAVCKHPSFAVDVVGITGTNGKTTCSYLLEWALAAVRRPTGVIGTIEQRFGTHRWPALHTTPESDDLARRLASMKALGATDVVMEVSSHAIALSRVAAVRFRVAALTNVTSDHLDFHGSRENYVATKRRLFEHLGPASSVLNLDDAVGRDLATVVPHAITFSASGDRRATFACTDATLDASGIRATIASGNRSAFLTSRLIGRHNLENLLLALGVLHALDVPLDRALEALRDAPAAPGRLQRVGEGDRAVLVDYAHTADALARVLETLRPLTPGRLICVFGCGGDRDAAKRVPMGEAVARGADVGVLTTDNPRGESPAEIARQAERGLVRGGMSRARSVDAERGYVVELDRAAAIGLAVRSARDGDVVLIAGKGHETYQEVRGIRTPFDDRDVAALALGGEP